MYYEKDFLGGEKNMEQCYNRLEQLMEEGKIIRATYRTKNTQIEITGKVRLVWNINKILSLSISGMLIIIDSIDSFEIENNTLKLRINAESELMIKILK